MAKTVRNGIFRTHEIWRDSKFPWRNRFHMAYELISQIILTHILLCRKLEILASRTSPKMDFNEYRTKSSKSLKNLISPDFELISYYFISVKVTLKPTPSYKLNLKISTNFVSRSSRKILKVSWFEINKHLITADFRSKIGCLAPYSLSTMIISVNSPDPPGCAKQQRQ